MIIKEGIWVPMNMFANFEVHDNTAALLEAHPLLMNKMGNHIAKVDNRPNTAVTLAQAVDYTFELPNRITTAGRIKQWVKSYLGIFRGH